MSININTTYTSGIDPLAFEQLQQIGKSRGVSLSNLPDVPAVGQNLNDFLPPLPAGNGLGFASSLSVPAFPSAEADLLALISEIADEQRRANSEQKMLSSMAIADSMRDQADTIRDKAVTQLVMGLVSSSIQIGASIGSVVGSAKALSSTSGISDAGLHAAVLQTKNAQVSGAQSGVGALAGMIDQVSNYLGASYDATIKETDAQIEMIRAQKEAAESVHDSLKAVIEKATSTQDMIQQSMNQTRAKILG